MTDRHTGSRPLAAGAYDAESAARGASELGSARAGFASDVGAVAWKEAHELWRAGSGRASRGGIVLIVAVFGIIWPIMFGRALVEAPISAAYWLWLPMMLIGQVVIDAVAGERDRHTLESLLATRLPAGAILAGKLLTAIAYGCVLALAVVALGVVTINVTVPHPPDRLLLVEPVAFVAVAIVFVLIAALMAAIAALVSIRASLRQAQQLFGVGVVAVTLLPLLALNVLPEFVRSGLADALSSLPPAADFGLLVVTLALVDAILLGASVVRFRRSDLILE